MAFLGYFRIAVLARLLRDIYNFSNRVAFFLLYFPLNYNILDILDLN